MNKSIKSLKLHQSTKVTIYTEVMRVVGGLIYTIHSSNDEDDRPNSCFVPFHNFDTDMMEEFNDE